MLKDRLITVAVSGGKGRVIVRHWLDQTVEQAIENFKKWWGDLQIVELYKSSEENKNKHSAFSIPSLARATLRESKDQKVDKLIGDRIVQLYRASLDAKMVIPVTLLKPILDEFNSALVKNDESDPEKKTDPFNQSRFALIKLILIRNRKEGDFMPEPELCKTDDPAYNLGRLLAVFENLQYNYRNPPSERKGGGRKSSGAGVVERYYGSASTAPAVAFPILCRLARNHLSKLKKGSEEDRKVAGGIEKGISEIMGQFKSESSGASPTFPRFLTLEKQGRFALGFYQQKAYRRPATTIENSDNNE